MQAKAQLQMLSELESQVHRKESELLQLNEDVDLKTQMLIGFSKHRIDHKHLEEQSVTLRQELIAKEHDLIALDMQIADKVSEKENYATEVRQTESELCQARSRLELMNY